MSTMAAEQPRTIMRSNSDPSPNRSTRLPPLASILGDQSIPTPIKHGGATPSKKQVSLPSISHLTSSPGYSRSRSFPSISLNDPFIASSNASSNLYPVTPSRSASSVLPPLPSFAQSTPSTNANTLPTPSFNQHLSPISREQSASPNTSLANLKRRSTSPAPSSESKKFAFISHSQDSFLSHEPDIDNARLARRKRRRTSPAELAILQKEFEIGHTPNKTRRLEIAAKVDMTEKAVQIWFQNKRQAQRKSQNQGIKHVMVQFPKHNRLPSLNHLNPHSSINSSSISQDESFTRTTAMSTSNSMKDDSSTAETSRATSPASSPIQSPSFVLPAPIVSSSNSNSSSSSSHQLPPTGVFMTPMKPKSTALPVTSTPASYSNMGYPVNNAPLTFKFRSSDFGLISTPQSSIKRQKPTMKLKLSKSGPASTGLSKRNLSSVLKDSTNIVNNEQNGNRGFGKKINFQI